MNTNPEYSERILAENESLTTLIRGINLSLYDIENASNLRITSPIKKDITILAVEADCFEDLTEFLSIDYSKQLQDITLEPTVLDFIAIKKVIDPESQKINFSSLSLLDIILTNSMIDGESKENWTLDSKEFKLVELIPIENDGFLDKSINESDMRLFG